ncbi:hypothetical protein OE903_15515 [Bacillus sp. B6(2022)]|nr:hypothetical protein [Bacillus sp. B6(2022)]
MRVSVLGQIPLRQPDWNEDDFAPSVYDASHPTGEVYQHIANKVIEQLAVKA